MHMNNAVWAQSACTCLYFGYSAGVNINTSFGVTSGLCKAYEGGLSLQILPQCDSLSGNQAGAGVNINTSTCTLVYCNELLSFPLLVMLKGSHELSHRCHHKLRVLEQTYVHAEEEKNTPILKSVSFFLCCRAVI